MELGARMCLLLFTEDSTSLVLWSGELCCLMLLPTTDPGFLVGTNGVCKTHPSFLEFAQVKGGSRPLPLPPTALTSDSHTVGFLAIRSRSSSVQLCHRSRSKG